MFLDSMILVSDDYFKSFLDEFPEETYTIDLKSGRKVIRSAATQKVVAKYESKDDTYYIAEWFYSEK